MADFYAEYPISLGVALPGTGILSINADVTAAQTLVRVVTTGSVFSITDAGAGVHNFNLPALAVGATASTIALRDSEGNIIFNNSVSNVDTTVSSGSPVTLTSASALEQRISGTSAQTIVLPDATTLRIGWNYEVNNESTGACTVNHSGGTLLYLIPAGGWIRCILTDISTAAGVWDTHLFGPANSSWGTSALSLHGDLLFNPANGGSIGVGLNQMSGTDFRPQDAFISRAIIVGNPLGVSPPYGANNSLFTGMFECGNQVHVCTIGGSNTLANGVGMGFLGFLKDGGGANFPSFINLDTGGDFNVYFSLLHLSSSRADYLKFGAGDLTFMQSSGANLLWNTAGSGSVGSLSANQPTGVHALSTASVGGVLYQTTQATVNTTDDTQTTLQTFAIPTDKTVLVETRVTARRTGGASGSADDSSVFIIYSMVKNIAGTVTVNGLTPVYVSQDQAWDATILVSTTNIVIKVTGAVGNNITWNTTTITQQV